MSKTTAEINLINIDLTPQIKEILKRIGNNCTNEVRANSPVGNSGDYADGWTYELENDQTVVVYNNGKNKTLSHLLELGHRAKNGKTVPPQEHIRPAYNKSKQEYLDSLKQVKIKPN